MKACIKGKCPNEHEHADCLGSGEHEPHDWVYKQGWGGIRDFDYHCEGGGALVRDRLLVEPEKELKSTMSGRAVEEEGHSSGGAEQIRAGVERAAAGGFQLTAEQIRDVEELNSSGGAEHLSWLHGLMAELEALMQQRGRKYGPGNIAEWGDLGVIVRLSDKMARLRHMYQSEGTDEHLDESVEDTLMDIANYAVIALAWRRGLWPGSPKESAETAEGSSASD